MLRAFNSIKLRYKLPIVMGLMTIVSASIMALVQYNGATTILQNEAEMRLQALGSVQASRIQKFLEAIDRDITVTAASEFTIDSLAAFSEAFRDLDRPEQSLQRIYIEQNPHPLGQKDQLVRANSGNSYDSVHADRHPFFDRLQNTYDYYDIFLFDTEGNLVYSVFKEADFATNVVKGRWQDSGLGEVFKKAIALESGSPSAFVDFAPYEPSAMAPASFIGRPVFNTSGKKIGVLAYQMPADTISATMRDVGGLGETGEAYLVGVDGFLRSDSIVTPQNDILATRVDIPSLTRAFTGVEVLGEYQGPEGKSAVWFIKPIEFLGSTFGVVAKEDSEEIFAPLAQMRQEFLVNGGIIVFVALVFSCLFSWNITAPLTRLGTATARLVAKNYHEAIPDRARGDEIGGVSNALEEFRMSLQSADAARAKVSEAEKHQAAMAEAQSKVVKNLQIGLNRLAEGDLTTTIDVTFADDYEELRRDFNAAMSTILEAITDIMENADFMNDEVAEVSAAANDLARRTEGQAASLEQTAAAVEQLVASVKMASERTTEASGIVESAHKGAMDSGTVVREAVKAMGEIESSSSEISNIISVIEGIAFQTNLLALNAGVEAARAGEAGRGFAVVASEVRALAQSASKAASEISGLITASGDQVKRGVSLVGQAGEALREIENSVANIATHVRDIAQSSVEQSASLSEISITMGDLDRTTQRNAAMAEETTAVSQALKGRAAALVSTTGRFSIAPKTNTHQFPKDASVA